jgi:hypothetical protein
MRYVIICFEFSKSDEGVSLKTARLQRCFGALPPCRKERFPASRRCPRPRAVSPKLTDCRPTTGLPSRVLGEKGAAAMAGEKLMTASIVLSLLLAAWPVPKTARADTRLNRVTAFRCWTRRRLPFQRRDNARAILSIGRVLHRETSHTVRRPPFSICFKSFRGHAA